MTPANAEGVARRIGVDLVTFLGREVGSRPKHTGAESDGFIVGALRILDVKVQVNLLFGRSVGPLWRSVVRGVLHTDEPRATLIDHAVELFVIVHDVAVKQRGPEGALNRDIGRVEDDHVSHEFHARTLPVATESGVAKLLATTSPSESRSEGEVVSGLSRAPAPG